MGLLDLNTNFNIPGIGNLTANANITGAAEYLNLDNFITSGYSFSTKLDGQDWYKIFPYQFVLVDLAAGTNPIKSFADVVPEPVAPAAGAAGPPDPSSFAGGIGGSDSNFSGVGGSKLTQGQYQTQVNQYLDDMADWKKKKEEFDAAAAAEEDQNARKVIYTLPIPPESLGVKPVFASEATPTLSGVVEETSPVVFWVITLSGTTGIAIGRKDTDTAATVFRDKLGTTGLLSGIGASLNKLASTVVGVAGAIDEIGSADSFAEGASGVADLAQAALLPKLPYFQSAVPDGSNDDSNGYLEMHLLHRFLIAYGDQKAKNPEGIKLYFINHKDGQQFRVIVKDFQIQKSMNEPHLYRYKITLKGWDIKDPAQVPGGPIDRFKTDLKPVNTTTLTNISNSIKNLVTNSMGNPTNIVPVVL